MFASIYSMQGGISGGTHDGTFQGIIESLSLQTNLKMALDAGDSSSYSSGTKWLDTSGNGFDAFLGIDAGTSGDTTFTGSAGGKSDGEYFLWAGTSFTKLMATDTKEAWQETLHKDGAIFSMVMWIYPTDNTDGGALLGTSNDNGNSARGFRWHLSTSGVNGPKAAMRHGAAIGMGAASTTPLTQDAWNFVGLTIDEATGSGGGFHYLNGSYNQVGGADTFDATYTSPSASGMDGAMRILGQVTILSDPYTYDGYQPTTGTRCAMVGCWQGSVLSKANMDSIYAESRGRYGV